MRFYVTTLLMFATLTLAGAADSCAKIIRLRLTGTIEVGDSDNILPDDIVSGTPFVALWSYDTSLPNTADPNQTAMFGPAFGRYEHPLADPLTAPFGLSVQINEHIFRFDTSLEPYTVGLSVGRFINPDVNILGRGDGIGTGSHHIVVPFEYRTAHTIHDNMTLSFNDGLFATEADSSLLSTDLPRMIDPSEFGSAIIGISGASRVSVGGRLPPAYNIFAIIDTVTVVPEPASFLLIVSAAFPVLYRHRLHN